MTFRLLTQPDGIWFDQSNILMFIFAESIFAFQQSSIFWDRVLTERHVSQRPTIASLSVHNELVQFVGLLSWKHNSLG